MTKSQNGPNKKGPQPKTREEKIAEILRVLDTEDVPESVLDEIIQMIEEQEKP
jgi:hypothetical protein